MAVKPLVRQALQNDRLLIQQAYDKEKFHYGLQLFGLRNYVSPSENHPVYRSITDAAAAGTKVRLVP